MPPTSLPLIALSRLFKPFFGFYETYAFILLLSSLLLTVSFWLSTLSLAFLDLTDSFPETCF